MFDYRNNLRKIIDRTTGDDQSLRNGLTAIKLILGMTEEEVSPKSKKSHTDSQQLGLLFSSLAKLLQSPGESRAKKNALSAIHQLMYTPNDSSTYHQSITELEQAIRASKTTKDVINKRVFETALEQKKHLKEIIAKASAIRLSGYYLVAI